LADDYPILRKFEFALCVSPFRSYDNSSVPCKPFVFAIIINISRLSCFRFLFIKRYRVLLLISIINFDIIATIILFVYIYIYIQIC